MTGWPELADVPRSATPVDLLQRGPLSWVPAHPDTSTESACQILVLGGPVCRSAVLLMGRMTPYGVVPRWACPDVRALVAFVDAGVVVASFLEAWRAYWGRAQALPAATRADWTHAALALGDDALLVLRADAGAAVFQWPGADPLRLSA